MRVSTSPILAPRMTERMTSVRAPRSRRARGSATSSSADRSPRCCHRCALSTSETTSPPDPTGPNRERCATTNSCSVSYRLDTPAPPTVARLWHRLVSRSEQLSLAIRSSEMPDRCGIRLEPCRDVTATVDPHRPCQTRDSRYHRNAERADWSRTATRFASGDAPEKSRRIPLAPSTPRKTSPKNVQHRRGLPAHRVCCHPLCGTAC